jgi:hypothetical protein
MTTTTIEHDSAHKILTHLMMMASGVMSVGPRASSQGGGDGARVVASFFVCVDNNGIPRSNPITGGCKCGSFTKGHPVFYVALVPGPRRIYRPGRHPRGWMGEKRNEKKLLKKRKQLIKANNSRTVRINEVVVWWYWYVCVIVVKEK